MDDRNADLGMRSLRHSHRSLFYGRVQVGIPSNTACSPRFLRTGQPGHSTAMRPLKSIRTAGTHTGLVVTACLDQNEYPNPPQARPTVDLFAPPYSRQGTPDGTIRFNPICEVIFAASPSPGGADVHDINLRSGWLEENTVRPGSRSTRRDRP